MLALLLKSDIMSQYLDKLPEEVRKMLLQSVERMNNTISSLLLKSTEDSFAQNYEQAKREFLKNVISIIFYFIAKPNDIKELLEIYFKASSDYENKIADKRPAIYATIINAIEIMRNYLVLILSKPDIIIRDEYKESPAFHNLANLALCIGILDEVSRKEDRETNKLIVNKLVQKCEEEASQLESFVETMEIETDPEQMEIFERVAAQPQPQ